MADNLLFCLPVGFLSRMRLAPLAAGPEQLKEPGADLWEDLARSKRQEELHHFLGGRIKEFICGCDQVGTVKIIKDLSGRSLKSLAYDSFGNVLADSFPLLFMPISFAGGLVDRDTGLIRFGWRDYDPLVGRFTAPDPANAYNFYKSYMRWRREPPPATRRRLKFTSAVKRRSERLNPQRQARRRGCV